MFKFYTKPFDGGPFNCRPSMSFDIEGGAILCNNIMLPGAYNPHNVKIWAIGHQFGPVCLVWGSCEQDALDEAVDNGMLDCFLCEDQDYDSPDNEGMASLGNAGELFDLDTCWITELDVSQNEYTFALWMKFAEAQGNGSNDLNF